MITVCDAAHEELPDRPGRLRQEVPRPTRWRLLRAEVTRCCQVALDSRGVPSAAKIVQVAGTGGAAAAASVPTTAAPEIARTAVDPEAPEGD